MTAQGAGWPLVPQALRGDLVVACADRADGSGSAYEIGVVTRVRDGLADTWRTVGGAVRPARFVPGLRYRWLVPRGDVDVARALSAAGDRGGRFASLSEVREVLRPWLRQHDHQIEAPDAVTVTLAPDADA